MNRTWSFGKAGLIAALLLHGYWGLPAAHTQEAAYESVTASDADIPTDELGLLVKPLTLSELKVEVVAWMELVKTKSIEVSAAEIAIKRKNEESKAAEGAADALETAQKATEEAEAAAEEAASKGDAATAKEARKAQEEAAEAVEEAQEAVIETVEASNRSEQDEVIADAIETAEQEAGATTDNVVANDLDGDVDAPEDLGESASVAQQVADVAAGQKANLLENVNQLREERVALVDRARVVLDEQDAKGGDSGEARLYLTAVSGIEVDVWDLDALRATIVGWFKSEQGGIRWALNVGNFVGILLGFWLLSKIAGALLNTLMRSRQSKHVSVLMQAFVSKMIGRAVLLIGVIIALQSLEISVAPLMATIGAAGFVVAFAMQDSLSNFASGIMILLYRPFDVGDVVEAGGVHGKVTSLNLVSVGINTFDNRMVLVPNNKVWNDVIINATAVRERRVDMVFGIGYGDDLAQAQTVLERILAEHELVLEKPDSVVKVHELADSSVNYVCRPWVKTDDYWAVYWDVTRKVKEEFDAAGISIPYPQQDVHMHQVNPEVSPEN